MRLPPGFTTSQAGSPSLLSTEPLAWAPQQFSPVLTDRGGGWGQGHSGWLPECRASLSHCSPGSLRQVTETRFPHLQEERVVRLSGPLAVNAMTWVRGLRAASALVSVELLQQGLSVACSCQQMRLQIGRAPSFAYAKAVCRLPGFLQGRTRAWVFLSTGVCAQTFVNRK